MEDSKAAGRWETEQGGEYFAVGVEGAVTGRGADLLIIDDPHSEQDAMSKKSIRPSLRMVHSWTTTTFTTRWKNCFGYDTLEQSRSYWVYYKQHKKNLKLINGKL